MGLEVAFTDVGGWDTHAAEGGGNGQLANRLRDFAQAIAAFAKDLGSRMADVTLVTMSEFGRTVSENGNRGTDHGHANVMLLLGGGVGAARSTASGRAWTRRTCTRTATSPSRPTSATSSREVLAKRMGVAVARPRLPRLRLRREQAPRA